MDALGLGVKKAPKISGSACRPPHLFSGVLRSVAFNSAERKKMIVTRLVTLCRSHSQQTSILCVYLSLLSTEKSTKSFEFDLHKALVRQLSHTVLATEVEFVRALRSTARQYHAASRVRFTHRDCIPHSAFRMLSPADRSRFLVLACVS